MRPSLLFALSIFMGFSPLAEAKSPEYGGDLFVVAYLKADQGIKAEQAGHLDIARAKFQIAARMFDEIGKKLPFWSLVIVKNQMARTAASIARLRYEIAKLEFGRLRELANGGAIVPDLADEERQLNEFKKRMEELEQRAPPEPAPNQEFDEKFLAPGKKAPSTGPW
jgi:hypothetical protein